MVKPLWRKLWLVVVGEEKEGSGEWTAGRVEAQVS